MKSLFLQQSNVPNGESENIEERVDLRSCA